MYRSIGFSCWGALMAAWRIGEVVRPAWRIDRDGRVYLPDRKVELRAKV
jgi:hypothetical protein